VFGWRAQAYPDETYLGGFDMPTDDCVKFDAAGVDLQPTSSTYDMDDELDGIIFGTEELEKVHQGNLA
jgi:hypothetical protein